MLERKAKTVAEKETIEKIEEPNIISSKVVLIGNPAAGKSSIRRRLIENRFIANSRSTMGSEFTRKSYETRDNSQLSVIFWEVGGDTKYRSQLKLALRGSNVILLCVDIREENWQQQNQEILDTYCDPSIRQIAPIYLVMTKSDERKQDVDSQQTIIKEFALRNDIQSIFYVSSLEKENEELKALEESYVYTCYKQASEELEISNVSPAPPPNVINHQVKKEKITDDDINRIANEIVEMHKTIKLTRDFLLKKLKELNKCYKMDVIDKLKILQSVFEKSKNLIDEERPKPDKKEFWFKSRNLHFLGDDFARIEMLKDLYVDLIHHEPWSTEENRSITVNPVNAALAEYTDAQKRNVNSLIDFQQTQYRFFKTKETNTRKRVDLAVHNSVDRPKANFDALMYRFT